MTRRFTWRSAITLAGVIACGGASGGACGGDDSANDEGVPLPDRDFDASNAGTDAGDDSGDLTGLPPPDAGTKDTGSDAPVYIGCNGALDCERVAFTTSKTFGGGFGGIAEADLRCQTHADGAQSPRVKGRKFMAWVSTDTNSVATRFPKGTKAYVRPDGATIANDWTDLTNGDLATAISLNEDGASPGSEERVWTGTNISGTSSNSNCGNWKSAALNGQRGRWPGNGNGWSDFSNDACTQPGHLYCFEY